MDQAELQTLLMNMQQLTQAVANVAKAIAQPGALSNQTSAQIQNYTSDAAAAAGGVPLWGLYLNSATTPWSLVARHV